MSQLYTRTATGTIPVTLTSAKSYLKIPSINEDDDDFVTLLIEAATDFAEKYTARDLRANTWTLLIDAFEDRICLRRDPVNLITTVKYLDDESVPAQQTVGASVYYLKNGVQASEILLQPDQEWPDGSTDVLTVNEREHSIEIVFDTKAHQCLSQARLGILRHVGFLYENRGDCDPADSADSAKRSGASILYDQIRISRV